VALSEADCKQLMFVLSYNIKLLIIKFCYLKLSHICVHYLHLLCAFTFCFVAGAAYSST
jgi:hypothetical protein